MLPADHGHGTERIVGKSIGKEGGLSAHDPAVLEEEVLGESRGLLLDILRTKRASARLGLIHQRLEILLGKLLQAHGQDARYMAGDGAGSNFSGLLDNLKILERAFEFGSKNTFCDLNFHHFPLRKIFLMNRKSFRRFSILNHITTGPDKAMGGKRQPGRERKRLDPFILGSINWGKIPNFVERG